MQQLRKQIEIILAEHPGEQNGAVIDSIMGAIEDRLEIVVSETVNKIHGEEVFDPEQYSVRITKAIADYIETQRQEIALAEDIKRVIRGQYRVMIVLVAFIIVWTLWLHPLISG